MGVNFFDLGWVCGMCSVKQSVSTCTSFWFLNINYQYYQWIR